MVARFQPSRPLEIGGWSVVALQRRSKLAREGLKPNYVQDPENRCRCAAARSRSVPQAHRYLVLEGLKPNYVQHFIQAGS